MKTEIKRARDREIKARTGTRGRFAAIATFIRAARERNGLGSARALAQRIGVSHAYITMLERGYQRPGWPTLKRLMRALELDSLDEEALVRLWILAGTCPRGRAFILNLERTIIELRAQLARIADAARKDVKPCSS